MPVHRITLCRLLRLSVAVAMVALISVTPYVAAGPSIIRDEMLQDTAITPALGRGYSIATNTYQSMCLVDVVSTTPSYDFDYSFENIENKTETTGSMATTKGTKGKTNKQQSTQKTSSLDGYQLSEEWSTSRTDTDLGGSMSYQHMLATVSINVYYNSVDETRSKLSPAATKILESKDLPGFFDACGMYYVRSISRRARIYSLITYTTQTGERDVTLDNSIKSAIRSFSLSSSAKPLEASTAPTSASTDMIAGQEYISQNGLYRTIFQNDGNLCVYEGTGLSECAASFTKNGAAQVVDLEGHCYGRFDSATDQTAAYSQCQAAGGSLATINSARENVLVSGLASTASAWIGGDDLTTEGTFAWVTGEPFTYLNWASGQPDNANNDEDCVQMASGQWNDLSCTTALPYICEAVQAKPVWCSMTKGRGTRATIKANDISIYDAMGKVVWTVSKDRVGKDGDTRLVIQDDGNLVLLSANNQAVASIGTGSNRQNAIMSGKPDNAVIAQMTQENAEISKEQKQKGTLKTKTTGSNIQISTKAIGLGKQLGTMLISYDIDTYKKAVESAYKATLPDNVGKVSAIEVVPWMENTEFQSLFKLEEKTVPEYDRFGMPVMDLTDIEKPVQKTKKVLPYEQKRILQTNAEFLAEIDRAARAKLNVFYKAKMCKAQITADYMEMDEETGDFYFPDDKYAIANAIEIKKVSFGANCNPKNVDNLTSIVSDECNGQVRCDYKIDTKKVGDPDPGCQKAFEVEFRCLAPSRPGYHQLVVPKDANGKFAVIDCSKYAREAARAAVKSGEAETDYEAPPHPTIGQTTYVWNNRKPNESLLLEDVVNLLSETKLQQLWMEYDSFMYGGTGEDMDGIETDPAARAQTAREILLGVKTDVGYPKNIFPGANRCIGVLFAMGISTIPYRNIQYCQRIEETFVTISGQKIDDYCMPRFTQAPGQASIEEAIDAKMRSSDTLNNERTPSGPVGPTVQAVAAPASATTAPPP